MGRPGWDHCWRFVRVSSGCVLLPRALVVRMGELLSRNWLTSFRGIHWAIELRMAGLLIGRSVEKEFHGGWMALTLRRGVACSRAE